MIKSFALGAKKYRVVKKNHNSTNLGRALSPLGKIEIQTLYDGEEIPDDSQMQTLVHEVVHCIFDDVGRVDLNSDEGLVQSVALLFHQFMETAK